MGVVGLLSSAELEATSKIKHVMWPLPLQSTIVADNKTELLVNELLRLQVDSLFYSVCLWDFGKKHCHVC